MRERERKREREREREKQKLFGQKTWQKRVDSANDERFGTKSRPADYIVLNRGLNVYWIKKRMREKKFMLTSRLR